MTTTVEALAKLSRRIARCFQRLFGRISRKAELTFAMTISIPPFVKLELHFKKAFAASSSALRRSRRRRPA